MNFNVHLERAFKRIAEQETWTPRGGSATTIYVDFRVAYFESLLGDVGVSGSKPIAYVLRSETAAMARNDILTIDGTDYAVSNVEREALSIFNLVTLRGPIVSLGGKLILDDGGGLQLDDGGTLEIDS